MLLPPQRRLNKEFNGVGLRHLLHETRQTNKRLTWRSASETIRIKFKQKIRVNKVELPNERTDEHLIYDKKHTHHIRFKTIIIFDFNYYVIKVNISKQKMYNISEIKTINLITKLMSDEYRELQAPGSEYSEISKICGKFDGHFISKFRWKFEKNFQNYAIKWPKMCTELRKMEKF